MDELPYYNCHTGECACTVFRLGDDVAANERRGFFNNYFESYSLVVDERGWWEVVSPDGTVEYSFPPNLRIRKHDGVLIWDLLGDDGLEVPFQHFWVGALSSGRAIPGPVVNDPVNRPQHYTSYNGLEVIDLTEQLNFNRGNVVKYICRAGLKDGSDELEDLKKAKWYVEREIGRVIQLRAKDEPW